MNESQTSCKAACPCGSVVFQSFNAVDPALTTDLSSLVPAEHEFFLAPNYSIGLKNVNSVTFEETEHPEVHLVRCSQCSGAFYLLEGRQILLAIPGKWLREWKTPFSFLPIVRRSRGKIPVSILKYFTLCKHFSQSPVSVQAPAPRVNQSTIAPSESPTMEDQDMDRMFGEKAPSIIIGSNNRPNTLSPGLSQAGLSILSGNDVPEQKKSGSHPESNLEVAE